MVEEISIKSHLIIDNIQEEYKINWCGKLAAAAPVLVEGLPVFVIIGSRGRVEMNTINMRQLEECAKRLTQPKGRATITQDSSHIYIKEINGKETLMCVVTHRTIRHYVSMHDKVGYR